MMPDNERKIPKQHQEQKSVRYSNFLMQILRLCWQKKKLCEKNSQIFFTSGVKLQLNGTDRNYRNIRHCCHFTGIYTKATNRPFNLRFLYLKMFLL